MRGTERRRAAGVASPLNTSTQLVRRTINVNSALREGALQDAGDEESRFPTDRTS